MKRIQESTKRRFVSRILENDKNVERFDRVREISNKVRASEYHITNACNIRCKGCWFFEKEFDKSSGREVKNLDVLREFVEKERARGVNAALLIGGEPTLFLDRIEVYLDIMDYVSISTNGLKQIPYSGFENVTVFVSLFGGGKLDDDLRAIAPSGKPFTGLFDMALENYKDDPRVTFVYALTEDCIDDIEDTVAKIYDNGNRLSFNYYSKYGTDSPLGSADKEQLMETALRIREKYPDTVLSSEYYIRALLSGEGHWGDKFGYEVCPSLSADHPAHKERKKNGKGMLPLFNTYAPDLETINFCCTSGECGDCRDSQAMYSWLLMSVGKFVKSKVHLEQWIDLAEGYWKQFIWSPYYSREDHRDMEVRVAAMPLGGNSSTINLLQLEN